ncbi:Abortive infection protein [Sulfobacillus thermosulfidooxidans DSM 9293]|uniref:Abortive infection protein n=1 Tax=Sulfobacillus thermosulfidooxidans (strain DSM 9293 / VKM B-1269 / AT-1) TaxID=929705 RepID=A0A1W1WKI5_SULTA|nr:CPBP family intramembrane glutamic endopeptidase [Sulfobacillus thermosulfidooxidans]SMC06786.1 Abortive infection protein [Sulfobacillus thermosulfidooxidans DSM 9293]
MKKLRSLQKFWPGVFSPPAQNFLQPMASIAAWRVFLATVMGGCAVLILGNVTKSSMAGYGYGAVLFTALSWPYVPQLLKTIHWTDMTIAQSLLLLIASIGLGEVAQRILGFNPQAQGMKHMNWPIAIHLLWQFPLVLPVENLLLIGSMAWLWKFLRPTSPGNRLGVAVLSAALFGLWHVPFWGGWTMWTISLSVLPWTLYMMATGDILVPLIAHILMDVIAMISTFAPPNSVIIHLLWPLLGIGLILLGLGHSLYQDWRVKRRKIA